MYLHIQITIYESPYTNIARVTMYAFFSKRWNGNFWNESSDPC